MKKILVAKLALAGTVGLVAAMAAGTAGAADCSGCHTMHNSQDGAPMRFDSGVTPLPILLRDDCIGCHSGLNTLADLNAGLPPKVIGTAAPLYTPIAGGAGTADTTLAGGDFWWVIADDSKGHNILTVTGADGTLSVAPGGTATSVTCAGTTGCHGNGAATELSSLNGAHHFAHTNATQALTSATAVGNSFRYLLGVYGAEDTNWQFTEDASDHNQYFGLNRLTDTATSANTHTLSALCARCHGAYHNKVDGGIGDTFGINNGATFAGVGDWIRHPTDYSVGTTGEYAAFTTYQPETPVGRLQANLGTASSVVGAANRVVLCVSCHRAHGSPYADALRWNYTSMQVGTGVTNGCMNCHTAK